MRIEAPWVAAVVGGSPFGDLESIVIDGVDFDSRTIAQVRCSSRSWPSGTVTTTSSTPPTVGAVLHLCSDPAAVAAAGVPAVLVEDTLLALGSLAAAVRDELLADTRVVGITGSVGKTSTKDLTSAALSAGLVTHANRASFNNEQGLPVTVLTAPDGCAALVVEMGMRGHGQIAELCRIARPDIGVVTAVGESHTELVGGLDGVARAKGELVEALPSTGTAILNADRPARARDVIALRWIGAHLRGRRRCQPRADRARRSSSSQLRRPNTLGLGRGAPHALGRAHGVKRLRGASLSPVLSGWMSRLPRRDGVGAGSSGADGGGGGSQRTRRGRRHLQREPDFGGGGSPRPRRGSGIAHHVAMLGLMAELEDPGPSHVAITELCRRLGVRLMPVECDLYGVEPVALDDWRAISASTTSTAVLVKGSRVAGLERVVGFLTNQPA